MDRQCRWLQRQLRTLTRLEWQVHVYGEASPKLASACRSENLPLHVFQWRTGMERSGLMRDAAYLVRPDGHVALADPTANPLELGSLS